MSTRVLVAGGAGYIGGCVTDELIRLKVPFTVYDNLTYERCYLKPVNFIYGDVRNRSKLKDLLRDHTHVIWLAAIVGDAACEIKPELTHEINAESVAWLATHFKRKIIFTSTCSVYGLNEKPVSENSVPNPLSTYARTKLLAEKNLDKSDALIFRLGTAFGRGDTFSRIRMDLVVNYMTFNALQYKKITVFGGNQWRPFIHVRDIARIITSNLFNKHKGTYNITTQNMTITNLAKIIQLETHCAVEFTDEKMKDTRNYRAIVKKALADKLFATHTRYTIRYGVKEMRELVISKRVRELDQEYYSNHKMLLKTIELYKNTYLNE